MASAEIQTGDYKLSNGTISVSKVAGGRTKLVIQTDGASPTTILLNENGYEIPSVAATPATPAIPAKVFASGGSATSVFPSSLVSSGFAPFSDPVVSDPDEKPKKK